MNSSSVLSLATLMCVIAALAAKAEAGLSTPAELELYSRYSNQGSLSAVRHFSDKVMRGGRVSDIETRLIANYADRTRCLVKLRTTDGNIASVSVAEGFKVMSRNPLMTYAGRAYMNRPRLSAAYSGRPGKVWVDEQSATTTRALAQNLETRLRNVFELYAERLKTAGNSVPSSMNQVVLLAEVQNDNGFLAKDLRYKLQLVEVDITNLAIKETYTPVGTERDSYGSVGTSDDTIYDRVLQGEIRTKVLFEAADFRFNCDELKSETELNNETAPGYSTRAY